MLKKPATYRRITLAALLVTTLFAGCGERNPDSFIASGKDYLAKNDSKAAVIQFKNALQIKEVASFVALDRLLVETDAPYLAPVPYRGKLNHPALVRHVAEEVAKLKGLSLEALTDATTNNFFRLFGVERNA